MPRLSRPEMSATSSQMPFNYFRDEIFVIKNANSQSRKRFRLMILFRQIFATVKNPRPICSQNTLQISIWNMYEVWSKNAANDDINNTYMYKFNDLFCIFSLSFLIPTVLILLKRVYFLNLCIQNILHEILWSCVSIFRIVHQ